MYCDLIICFLFTNNSLNTTTRHSSTDDAVVVVAIFAECAISLAIPEESGICANNVLPRYLLYRFTCQDRTPTGSLLPVHYIFLCSQPCALFRSSLATVAGIWNVMSSWRTPHIHDGVERIWHRRTPSRRMCVTPRWRWLLCAYNLCVQGSRNGVQLRRG